MYCDVEAIVLTLLYCTTMLNNRHISINADNLKFPIFIPCSKSKEEANQTEYSKAASSITGIKFHGKCSSDYQKHNH